MSYIEIPRLVTYKPPPDVFRGVKLKKCPLCGEYPRYTYKPPAPYLQDNELIYTTGHGYLRCNIHGYGSGAGGDNSISTKERTIELWNERVDNEIVKSNLIYRLRTFLGVQP